MAEGSVSFEHELSKLVSLEVPSVGIVMVFEYASAGNFIWPLIPPALLYMVSQEERLIFWEVIVLVILCKKMYIYTCVLFRKLSKIELFHCTVPELLIKKNYYILFLIPVFIVQVTKLVQFT
jgi:hypothetical protein